jgi:diacylglycerol kinase family enzyme
MSRRPTAIMVVNPAARSGAGASLFQSLQAHLERALDFDILETDAQGTWTAGLHSALQEGHRFIVTAGGDGTASHVITEIVASGVPLAEITLGAIGLGSSNDLHKPVSNRLVGVPVRLNAHDKTVRDVGRIQYWNGQGQKQERSFLVSASVGITAQANAFFNQEDPLLRVLKRGCVSLAVMYAAVRTLWHYRATRLLLRIGGKQWAQCVANLSMLKTAYLAGTLRFDTPVAPDSGMLAVNLCPNRSRASLLFLLANLLFGRFSRLRGVSHWHTAAVEIVADESMPIEVDGEVVNADRAVVDIRPQRIWLCRS